MKATPIQTRYAGHLFRSRLEARWAVWFDSLKVRWDYEPEGFDLGDGFTYLPDFWLPNEEFWVEVKPEPLNEREQEVAFRLAEGSHSPVVSFVGPPSRPAFAAYFGWNRPERKRFPWPSDEFYMRFETGMFQDFLLENGYEVPDFEPTKEMILEYVKADRDYWAHKYGGEHPQWRFGFRSKHLGMYMGDDGKLVGHCAWEFENPTFRDNGIERAVAKASQARFEHGGIA